MEVNLSAEVSEVLKCICPHDVLPPYGVCGPLNKGSVKRGGGGGISEP